jgi:hypothetical protein
MITREIEGSDIVFTIDVEHSTQPSNVLTIAREFRPMINEVAKKFKALHSGSYPPPFYYYDLRLMSESTELDTNSILVPTLEIYPIGFKEIRRVLLPFATPAVRYYYGGNQELEDLRIIRIKSDSVLFSTDLAYTLDSRSLFRRTLQIYEDGSFEASGTPSRK